MCKIYATSRHIDALPNFNDNRVIPLSLDITNNDSVTKASESADDINILFNNAGILTYARILTSSTNELMVDMNTNYYGTLRMIHAFAPLIHKNGCGAIANTISIVGLANMPLIGGYSASKAALFSSTQALRAELKKKNISVHGIFRGPIETDMAANINMQKTPASVAAHNIIEGLKSDTLTIFPDPMSFKMGQIWLNDPMNLEAKISII